MTGLVRLEETGAAASVLLASSTPASVHIAMSSILIRNTATISITVLDAGVEADPATLVARVVDPEGGESSYTYGVDSEIQRDGTGAYTLSVPVGDLAGRWRYSVTTTTPDAYAEGAQVVDPSRLPE